MIEDSKSELLCTMLPALLTKSILDAGRHCFVDDKLLKILSKRQATGTHFGLNLFKIPFNFFRVSDQK